MRKNTAQVLRAWSHSKPCRPCNAIHTDGQNIFSYGTCILAERDSGAVVFNRTKYSQTTSVHQNDILSEMTPDYTVDGAPQGIAAFTLGEVALNPEYRFFIEDRDGCKLDVRL